LISQAMKTRNAIIDLDPPAGRFIACVTRPIRYIKELC